MKRDFHFFSTGGERSLLSCGRYLRKVTIYDCCCKALFGVLSTSFLPLVSTPGAYHKWKVSLSSQLSRSFVAPGWKRQRLAM